MSLYGIERVFRCVSALKGAKIVIVGCGAQGLNQGLNMRDSGLDISYALREAAIRENRQSFKMPRKTILPWVRMENDSRCRYGH